MHRLNDIVTTTKKNFNGKYNFKMIRKTTTIQAAKPFYPARFHKPLGQQCNSSANILRAQKKVFYQGSKDATRKYAFQFCTVFHNLKSLPGWMDFITRLRK